MTKDLAAEEAMLQALQDAGLAGLVTFGVVMAMGIAAALLVWLSDR